MTDREALVLLATAPGTVPELARAYDASRSALKAMDGGFWLGGNIRGIVAAGLVAADHGQDASDAITGATLSAIIVAIQTAVLVSTAVAVT